MENTTTADCPRDVEVIEVVDASPVVEFNALPATVIQWSLIASTRGLQIQKFASLTDPVSKKVYATKVRDVIAFVDAQPVNNMTVSSFIALMKQKPVKVPVRMVIIRSDIIKNKVISVRNIKIPEKIPPSSLVDIILRNTGTKKMPLPHQDALYRLYRTIVGGDEVGVLIGLRGSPTSKTCDTPQGVPSKEGSKAAVTAAGSDPTSPVDASELPKVTAVWLAFPPLSSPPLSSPPLSSPPLSSPPLSSPAISSSVLPSPPLPSPPLPSTGPTEAGAGSEAAPCPPQRIFDKASAVLATRKDGSTGVASTVAVLPDRVGGSTATATATATMLVPNASEYTTVICFPLRRGTAQDALQQTHREMRTTASCSIANVIDLLSGCLTQFDARLVALAAKHHLDVSACAATLDGRVLTDTLARCMSMISRLDLDLVMRNAIVEDGAGKAVTKLRITPQAPKTTAELGSVLTAVRTALTAFRFVRLAVTRLTNEDFLTLLRALQGKLGALPHLANKIQETADSWSRFVASTPQSAEGKGLPAAQVGAAAHNARAMSGPAVPALAAAIIEQLRRHFAPPRSEKPVSDVALGAFAPACEIPWLTMWGTASPAAARHAKRDVRRSEAPPSAAFIGDLSAAFPAATAKVALRTWPTFADGVDAFGRDLPGDFCEDITTIASPSLRNGCVIRLKLEQSLHEATINERCRAVVAPVHYGTGDPMLLAALSLKRMPVNMRPSRIRSTASHSSEDRFTGPMADEEAMLVTALIARRVQAKRAAIRALRAAAREGGCRHHIQQICVVRDEAAKWIKAQVHPAAEQQALVSAVHDAATRRVSMCMFEMERRACIEAYKQNTAYLKRVAATNQPTPVGDMHIRRTMNNPQFFPSTQSYDILKATPTFVGGAQNFLLPIRSWDPTPRVIFETDSVATSVPALRTAALSKAVLFVQYLQLTCYGIYRRHVLDQLLERMPPVVSALSGYTLQDDDTRRLAAADYAMAVVSNVPLLLPLIDNLPSICPIAIPPSISTTAAGPGPHATMGATSSLSNHGAPKGANSTMRKSSTLTMLSQKPRRVYVPGSKLAVAAATFLLKTVTQAMEAPGAVGEAPSIPYPTYLIPLYNIPKDLAQNENPPWVEELGKAPSMIEEEVHMWRFRHATANANLGQLLLQVAKNCASLPLGGEKGDVVADHRFNEVCHIEPPQLHGPLALCCKTVNDRCSHFSCPPAESAANLLKRRKYPYKFFPTSSCRLASAAHASPCLNNYRSNQPIIQCLECGTWVHWACTGLPMDFMKEFIPRPPAAGDDGANSGLRFFRCSCCLASSCVLALEDLLKDFRRLHMRSITQALFGLVLANQLRYLFEMDFHGPSALMDPLPRALMRHVSVGGIKRVDDKGNAANLVDAVVRALLGMPSGELAHIDMRTDPVLANLMRVWLRVWRIAVWLVNQVTELDGLSPDAGSRITADELLRVDVTSLSVAVGLSDGGAVVESAELCEDTAPPMEPVHRSVTSNSVPEPTPSTDALKRPATALPVVEVTANVQNVHDHAASSVRCTMLDFDVLDRPMEACGEDATKKESRTRFRNKKDQLLAAAWLHHVCESADALAAVSEPTFASSVEDDLCLLPKWLQHVADCTMYNDRIRMAFRLKRASIGFDELRDFLYGHLSEDILKELEYAAEVCFFDPFPMPSAATHALVEARKRMTEADNARALFAIKRSTPLGPPRAAMSAVIPSPYSSLPPLQHNGPISMNAVQAGCIPTPRILQFGPYAGIDEWLLAWRLRSLLRSKENKVLDANGQMDIAARPKSSKGTSVKQKNPKPAKLDLMEDAGVKGLEQVEEIRSSKKPATDVLGHARSSRTANDPWRALEEPIRTFARSNIGELVARAGSTPPTRMVAKCVAGMQNLLPLATPYSRYQGDVDDTIYLGSRLPFFSHTDFVFGTEAQYNASLEAALAMTMHLSQKTELIKLIPKIQRFALAFKSITDLVSELPSSNKVLQGCKLSTSDVLTRLAIQRRLTSLDDSARVDATALLARMKREPVYAVPLQPGDKRQLLTLAVLKSGALQAEGEAADAEPSSAVKLAERNDVNPGQLAVEQKLRDAASEQPAILDHSTPVKGERQDRTIAREDGEVRDDPTRPGLVWNAWNTLHVFLDTARKLGPPRSSLALPAFHGSAPLSRNRFLSESTLRRLRPLPAVSSKTSTASADPAVIAPKAVGKEILSKLLTTLQSMTARAPLTHVEDVPKLPAAGWWTRQQGKRGADAGESASADISTGLIGSRHGGRIFRVREPVAPIEDEGTSVCVRPGCGKATVKMSKYCGADCALHVARCRLEASVQLAQAATEHIADDGLKQSTARVPTEPSPGTWKLIDHAELTEQLRCRLRDIRAFRSAMVGYICAHKNLIAKKAPKRVSTKTMTEPAALRKRLNSDLVEGIPAARRRSRTAGRTASALEEEPSTPAAYDDVPAHHDVPEFRSAGTDLQAGDVDRPALLDAVGGKEVGNDAANQAELPSASPPLPAVNGSTTQEDPALQAGVIIHEAVDGIDDDAASVSGESVGNDDEDGDVEEDKAPANQLRESSIPDATDSQSASVPRPRKGRKRTTGGLRAATPPRRRNRKARVRRMKSTVDSGETPDASHSMLSKSEAASLTAYQDYVECVGCSRAVKMSAFTHHALRCGSSLFDNLLVGQTEMDRRTAAALQLLAADSVGASEMVGSKKRKRDAVDASPVTLFCGQQAQVTQCNSEAYRELYYNGMLAALKESWSDVAWEDLRETPCYCPMALHNPAGSIEQKVEDVLRKAVEVASDAAAVVADPTQLGAGCPSRLVSMIVKNPLTAAIFRILMPHASAAAEHPHDTLDVRCCVPRTSCSLHSNWELRILSWCEAEERQLLAKLSCLGLPSTDVFQLSQPLLPVFAPDSRSKRPYIRRKPLPVPTTRGGRGRRGRGRGGRPPGPSRLAKANAEMREAQNESIRNADDRAIEILTVMQPGARAAGDLRDVMHMEQGSSIVVRGSGRKRGRPPLHDRKPLLPVPAPAPEPTPARE